MRMLALTLLLLFTTSGCNTTIAETPQQRYFALLAEYRSVLIVATTYKEDCDLKPTEDNCHGHVRFVQTLDTSVGAALENASKFRRAGQTASMSLALAAGQEAMKALTQYLLKAKGVPHAE